MWLALILVSMLNWTEDFVTPPFELQKSFIEDCINPDIQYVDTFCGIQSGKTYAESDGGYAALYGPRPIMLPKDIRGRIPMEVWLISKSYSLAEVLYETFRMRTPEQIWLSDAQTKRYGLTRGDRFTHWLAPRAACEDPCPIKLRVRTASDPQSLRATNKLGVAICDEKPWWKEAAWFNLQGRGIVVKTKFISAGSPHGRNFAYRTIAVPGGYRPGLKGRHPQLDPKIAVHTWTSRDNPHADQAHITRLEKIFGKEYARQELEGAFTDAIGFVFAQFDRATMCVRKFPSDNPADYDKIGGGIDPGWTDPFAGCIWGRYRGDRRWYQLWELHETQKTADDLAPRFVSAQSRWGVKSWYTDKRKPTDIDRLRRNGVKAVPNIDIYRESDRATIPPMLAVMQGLMQQDRIRIHEDHEWTAEEFEKYHYPDPNEDNPKNVNDIPVDYWNHHMDAGRYCLCALADVPQAGPRYRQGPGQTPKELPLPQQSSGFKLPSPSESLAAQDARMEEAIERKGGGRRSSPQWVKNRLRTRGRV